MVGSLMRVSAGRVCTKQWGRVGRRQGRWALVAAEAAPMRRVQAPSRAARIGESAI
jgi:hypothetical protein